MSENAFIRATRKKMRIATTKGPLSVEDLWDLPLQAAGNKPNLDDIAIGLDRKLKTTSGQSFVSKNVERNAEDQLAFDVVKYIIDTKLADQERADKAAATRAKNARIRELIAKKDDEELEGKSKDELLAMLDAEDKAA